MKYTRGSRGRVGVHACPRLPPSIMAVYETERHHCGRAAVTTGGLVCTMGARSTRTYLSACRHAHKLLTFVRKGNNGWGGPLAFVVFNHFGLIAVHNRHFERSASTAERGCGRERVVTRVRRTACVHERADRTHTGPPARLRACCNPRARNTARPIQRTML